MDIYSGEPMLIFEYTKGIISRNKKNDRNKIINLD